MRRRKIDEQRQLAEILHRHLGVGEERTNPSFDTCAGWAKMILWRRARGPENFLQSESRGLVPDLAKPIGQLREVLAKIEHEDRRRLQIAAFSYIEKMTGKKYIPKLADLEALLEVFERTIEWAKTNSPFIAKPRRFAHDGVAWARISTAHACRLVWAMNEQRLQTPRWLKHAQHLPEDQSGPHSVGFKLMDTLEAFAPRGANRDIPSPFARFLQEVLNFFPERDRNGNPPDASDTLRALRRVQKRMSTPS